MQKTQRNGVGDTRFFWKVSAVASNGQTIKTTYRSRCSTVDGVKTQFRKAGHKNIRVAAAHA